MSDNKTIYISNVMLYKSIVAESYRRYLDFNSEYEKIQNEYTEIVSEAVDSQLYSLQTAMDKEASVIFVFSEMTIEAFCRGYLRQNLSKRKVEKLTYEEAVEKTVEDIIKNSGRLISKKTIKEKYINKIIKHNKIIRNKIVHRYPVACVLDLSSVETLSKTALKMSEEIESKYLRRIKKEEVQSAAEAYDQLLKTLKSDGADLSKVHFIC